MSLLSQISQVASRRRPLSRFTPTLLSTNDGRRWKTSSKKEAMKRQTKQETASPASPTPARPDNFHSITMDPTSNLSNSQLILHGPQSTLQYQSGSIDLTKYWETDKVSMDKLSRNSTRLSDLPDDMLFDKEAMFDPSIHLPYAPQDWKGYEAATPLSEFLMQRIGVSGRPITTAEYMRHALTHPLHGYYTNPPKSSLQKSLDASSESIEDDWDLDENESTIIGPRGDFVTAPEVSHVFGHCLCVWFVTQWQSSILNRPEEVDLVELGPGRGTLMVDILQLATTSKLQHFGKAIQTVHFVEASLELRAQQQAALEKALGETIHFDFGLEDTAATDKPFSIRVVWHDSFSSYQHTRNKDAPVFLVAQEFLDALPVHAFQKTPEGWRERMVDVAVAPEHEDDQATSPPPTGDKELIPRLRQVLANDVTPAVELFLEPNRHTYANVPVGSVVEICPDAILLVQDVAKVLEESQGVALMIDYGQDGTADTLRAFSNHKQVPLTSYPGQVDVTADVDFFALRSCLSNNDPDKIHAFGPVTQGEFLMSMGAADMVIHSIEQEETTPEHAQRLTEALKYLVMPEHMGERFKVLALSQKRDGIFGPPGMER